MTTAKMVADFSFGSMFGILEDMMLRFSSVANIPNLFEYFDDSDLNVTIKVGIAIPYYPDEVSMAAIPSMLTQCGWTIINKEVKDINGVSITTPCVFEDYLVEKVEQKDKYLFGMTMNISALKGLTAP